MNQDIVYIIGEMSPESHIESSEEWHKIGKSSSKCGQNTPNDPLRERKRSLNQGNPRILTDKRYFLTPYASIVEEKVHVKIRNLGYQNMHDLTKTTGHKEWWKISVNDASRIIVETINECSKNADQQSALKNAQDELFNTFFK